MLLSTGALTLHYGDDIAWEIEYSPNGVDSGLCVGVARTAFQNEGVTLQPCGISGRTVWILDPGDQPATINHDYVPVINGSDTNFSHPFVRTYPKNGHPTDTPRPQVFVQNLTGFSHGPGDPISSVRDNQLWGADWGVLRQETPQAPQGSCQYAATPALPAGRAGVAVMSEVRAGVGMFRRRTGQDRSRRTASVVDGNRRGPGQ